MRSKAIDLDFRPKSYFWPLGLEAHLLSRVKGAERRAALKELIDAGRVDVTLAALPHGTLDAPEVAAARAARPRRDLDPHQTSAAGTRCCRKRRRTFRRESQSSVLANARRRNRCGSC